jgi:nickel-dependent lactate racemase
MKVTMPWCAWYGDRDLTLTFPDGWQVTTHPPADAPEIDDDAIAEALDHPVASPTLQEIVKGKSTVAIAVEDISRPCEAARVFPPLIARLQAGGIRRDGIRVVMSVGAHRPMVLEDILKKIGPAMAETLEVHNSFPYDNVVDLGTTRRGTPVRICRWIAEADVKIGLGTITPHGGPGLGGGAKIVVPGVAGIETIASIHEPGRLATGINKVEGNELREEVEEIARDHLGLDWIINVVTNSRRRITAVFAGDVVAAHRAGVPFARGVYRTVMPQAPVDAVVCNAYPKDTDYLQCGNALNVLRSCDREVLRPGGSTVIVTASPEGRGFHGIFGPGLRYDHPAGHRGRLVFSPNLSQADTRNPETYRKWDQVISILNERHGSDPRVAVFPCASIQLGTG